MKHLTADELETGFNHIMDSPLDNGELEMIVRRPKIDEREVLDHATLDVEIGLVGDNWKTKGSNHTDDGSAHPEMQINIMNSRVIGLVAHKKSRWPLAGDQLFVDLDLSPENLPINTRLLIGTAVLEVTSPPHLGCKKFATRFGVEATKFVNSRRGKKYNFRGINATVVHGGIIQTGDVVSKQ